MKNLALCSIDEKLVATFLEESGPYAFSSEDHASSLLNEWLVEAIEENFISAGFFLDIVLEWQSKLNYQDLGSLILKMSSRCDMCGGIGHNNIQCNGRKKA